MVNNVSDREERERLYSRARDELLAQQLHNAETYDRAILSISSAFLALSLAFIKDVIPTAFPSYLIVLYISWALFACAIISTITSIIYGQRGIKKLLIAAEKYYIGRDEDSFKVSEIISKRIDCINAISGVFFISAILFSIVFVGLNFWEVKNMSKETRIVTDSEKRGQVVNTFQKPTQTGQSSGGPDSKTNQPNGKDNSSKSGK